MFCKFLFPDCNLSFTFVLPHFDKQNFLILMALSLTKLSFMTCTFVLCLFFPTLRSHQYSPIFSTKGFEAFLCILHWLLYIVWGRYPILFPHVHLISLTPTIEWSLIFPMIYNASSVVDEVSTRAWECLLGSILCHWFHLSKSLPSIASFQLCLNQCREVMPLSLPWLRVLGDIWLLCICLIALVQSIKTGYYI